MRICKRIVGASRARCRPRRGRPVWPCTARAAACGAWNSNLRWSPWSSRSGRGLLSRRASPRCKRLSRTYRSKRSRKRFLTASNIAYRAGYFPRSRCSVAGDWAVALPEPRDREHIGGERRKNAGSTFTTTGHMRVKIARVCGGLVLFGLSTACSGKTESGDPAEHAGSGGALGNAGAGGAAAAGATSTAGATSAGSAGTGDASAGEGGADSGAAGDGGTGGVVYPPIDIGPQKTSDKLDVLFVVDNSVSMADKQTILSKSVSSFVTRLVNPLCLDGEGNPVATQPASGGANCPSGTREMTPVKDLHLGVITTSIGSHGGFVCSTGSADEHLDDHAQLLPSQRPNLPSFQGTGFLSYDAAGLNGVADATSVITDLKTTIDAATERGCGYEAPLEAMYRFLVDPQPPVSVTLVNNQSTPGAINQALLDQRHAFLRPDSAVAIVILSDENDCSIRDDSVGWFVGAQSRMPLSTTACATDANDPCCRSCATYETTPRAGCAALSDDANCKLKTSGQSYATWDAAHDSLNLRCFDQQRRFGFDLLYPVERYSDALSNPLVYNRNQELVPNPLLVGDEKGPPSATLISVSMIIGAPWQDWAAPASLGSGLAIEYMNGADLESSGRWPLLIGD